MKDELKGSSFPLTASELLLKKLEKRLELYLAYLHNLENKVEMLARQIERLEDK